MRNLCFLQLLFSCTILMVSAQEICSISDQIATTLCTSKTSLVNNGIPGYEFTVRYNINSQNGSSFSDTNVCCIAKGYINDEEEKWDETTFCHVGSFEMSTLWNDRKGAYPAIRCWAFVQSANITWFAYGKQGNPVTSTTLSSTTDHGQLMKPNKWGFVILIFLLFQPLSLVA
jgi:hypothetical protein